MYLEYAFRDAFLIKRYAQNDVKEEEATHALFRASRSCLLTVLPDSGAQYSAHLTPATARAATHLDISPAHPTPKEALAGTPTAQNIVLSRGGEENKNVFK